jgi:hypothetical protein
MSVYRNGPIPCPKNLIECLKLLVFENTRTSELDLVAIVIRHPCGPPNNFSCGLFRDAVGRPASGSLIQRRMAKLCATD